MKERNNIVNGSNNITLRKVNVKIFGFDKMYMNKKLIEDKLYRVINQFNERKITSTKFYSLLLKKNNHVLMEMVDHVRYCFVMMI